MAKYRLVKFKKTSATDPGGVAIVVSSRLPTGDKDPFALRRHALGVIRMLVEKDLALELDALVKAAQPAFGDKITDASQALADFFERIDAAAFPVAISSVRIRRRFGEANKYDIDDLVITTWDRVPEGNRTGAAGASGNSAGAADGDRRPEDRR